MAWSESGTEVGFYLVCDLSTDLQLHNKSRSHTLGITPVDDYVNVGRVPSYVLASAQLISAGGNISETKLAFPLRFTRCDPPLTHG